MTNSTHFSSLPPCFSDKWLNLSHPLPANFIASHYTTEGDKSELWNLLDKRNKH